MKTSTRNFIASLILGTGFFSAHAELITNGIIHNSINQQVLTYNVHHISCANANDGSIEINVTDGSTYFFSWDNGMNEEDITNLAPGIYRVKIETNQQEIIYASFEITAPELLQGYINQNDLHTTVNLDLVVQGGITPYNYLWTTNESTEDILGISTEGIYEVAISDANGCELNIGTYVTFGEAGLIEETINFEVYPNPSNGMGTIKWNNSDFQQIQLINGSGQLIQTIEVTNSNSVNFEGLAPGAYIAQIISEEETHSIQFIVQ